MGKSLVDNFAFELFGQGTDKTPFRSYVSSVDPTTAGIGVLIGGSQNTYLSLLGTIQNRYGLKRRGPADATIAGVIRSYEWETSLGATRVLRSDNGNLQVEFDPGTGLQYIDLLTGLTDSGMDFSFTPWYSPSLGKDLLIFVNGEQELNMWSGGLVAIESAANDTGIIEAILDPNNITDANTSEFSSGGINYAVGDLLTVSGGNSNAIVEVDSVVAGGIATVGVANGGSSYTVGDLVAIEYPIGGPIVNISAITSNGSGYVIGDTVTVGSGGAIFQVTTVTNTGAVTGLKIINGGTGYTSASAQSTTVISSANGLGLAISYTASGGTALLKVTGVTGGSVTSIQILVNGKGYVDANGVATSNVLTSSSPSGLTINITSVASTIATWHFKNNGSGYAASTTQAPSAVTGGAGTNASIWISLITSGRVTISGSDTLSELGFPGALTPTDGENVLSGGSFIANGTTWSYATLGDNGFSFLGLTNPSSLAGAVAAATVTVTDTSPDSSVSQAQLEANFTNDAVSTINNQIYLMCYASRLVHVSSSQNYTHYDVAALESGVLRTPGFPDLLTLDTNCRASSARDGNAVVFGSKGDSYLITRTASIYNQDNNSQENTAYAYEQVTIAKQISSDLSSPIDQNFLSSLNDSLIFLDDNNQLRQFGTLRNLNTPVYPFFSLDVYTEFANMDFTGGMLRVVAEQSGETVYITAPLSGTLYLYQVRFQIDKVGNMTAARIWQPPFIVGVSTVAVIDGVTYIYSNSNPQMYQLWNTGQYSDDSPSDEPVPYECHAIFAYISLPDRAQQLFFDKLYYEGYMTLGTTLYNNIYQEYQGSKNIVTINVNKPINPGKKLAKFYSSTSTPSLGDVSLGEVPLGEGITAKAGYQIPKFRVMRRTQAVDIFEFALDFASYDPDCNWQLLTIGVNIQSTTRRPLSIMG